MRDNNGGIAHLGAERSTVRELKCIYGEVHLVQAMHSCLVNGSTEAEGNRCQNWVEAEEMEASIEVK